MLIFNLFLPGLNHCSHIMSFYKSRQVSTQILLMIIAAYVVSGVQKFIVSPGQGSTLKISSSSSQANICKVCISSGGSPQCSTLLLLTDTTPVSVEFTCPEPEDVFIVETVRNIDCSASSCSNHIIQDDSGLQSLLAFPRRFTWNIKAPKAFKLDFTKMGLRQIGPSETCSDKHTFTLLATGNVLVGKYCRSGSISTAEVTSQGSFSVDVPAGQKLQDEQVDVSVGEEIKSPARVSLTLPKGTSTTELLSPNYPDSVPDDGVMEWDFQVPLDHQAAVEFRSVAQPRCLRKEPAVEYCGALRPLLVLSLDKAQPQQLQENFSMILSNCEVDRELPGSGLSLSFTVSASSSQDHHLIIILCVVTIPVVIFLITPVCIYIGRKIKKLYNRVSVDGPDDTNLQPENNRGPKTRQDNESSAGDPFLSSAHFQSSSFI